MSKVEASVIAVYVADADHMSGLPVSAALAAKYRVVPLRIRTKYGEKIHIDRVTDITCQASRKAGGVGNRYTCLATWGETQREIYLYKDEDVWFLEEAF